MKTKIVRSAKGNGYIPATGDYFIWDQDPDNVCLKMDQMLHKDYPGFHVEIQSGHWRYWSDFTEKTFIKVEPVHFEDGTLLFKEV